ncbi:hydroxyacid dehydrogenase [Loktanella sp. SALINAS62]|uniref:hydroxyacid dehydrogenase n=1 Tax=Loktanella sp. SALINAS62 TaxID=2706124 RepID=UPI001B8B8921|nr:hydroxyacid dehydrogenase [Loktanella sp. SALINAS62]MBS1301997.1 hydroxyacid dehydrogenase [Loktanella sp. SALINAS62]
MTKPLILSVPEPRSLDLIFSTAARRDLHARYDVLEIETDEIEDLADDTLGRIHYIIGQPALSQETLTRMKALRCIFNVESNLINNMPYDHLFERGIHVVTTGAVFAEPVAELGVAMALCLARDVVAADQAFKDGTETWGGESNNNAQLLSRSDIGIIGFGDLGRALTRLLIGFRANISVYDPWLPPSLLVEAGVSPASLDNVLRENDTIFVVASVTEENRGFLNASAFAKMRKGSRFILLSRSDVVNFEDLTDAVQSGHILAASDVFPEEPMPTDHPVRNMKGFLRSAHRAGALDTAFKNMGQMVMEDLDLLDRGLPPIRSKRAERETVARMRSKPVNKN